MALSAVPDNLNHTPDPFRGPLSALDLVEDACGRDGFSVVPLPTGPDRELAARASRAALQALPAALQRDAALFLGGYRQDRLAAVYALLGALQQRRQLVDGVSFSPRHRINRHHLLQAVLGNRQGRRGAEPTDLPGLIAREKSDAVQTARLFRVLEGAGLGFRVEAGVPFRIAERDPVTATPTGRLRSVRFPVAGFVWTDSSALETLSVHQLDALLGLHSGGHTEALTASVMAPAPVPTDGAWKVVARELALERFRAHPAARQAALRARSVLLHRGTVTPSPDLKARSCGGWRGGRSPAARPERTAPDPPGRTCSC